LNSILTYQSISETKNLIDSLKQGDLLLALKDKMFNAAGFDDYQEALTAANNQINSFITSFNSLVNKAAIRSAVTSQITQIVYNLLSGCGNQVFDLTLKPDVKAKVAVYASAEQQQREQGVAYTDINGVTVAVTNTETTPPTNTIVINPTLIT
jgi:hypothetical protein